MANRLKAYMDFLHGLPPTLTRTNFEAALTELYAHILQFLAQAIQMLKLALCNWRRERDPLEIAIDHAPARTSRVEVTKQIELR